jgi:hypothetical protein
LATGFLSSGFQASASRASAATMRGTGGMPQRIVTI